MKVSRKSWHYRWLKWAEQVIDMPIIELSDSDGEYIFDVFITLLFSPLLLIFAAIRWTLYRGKSPTRLEFTD